MSDARIPLYLITGFLDSGKTTLLTDTLSMEYFNDGQRTVLLCCEEGEVEYDQESLSRQNCRLVPIEEPEQITTAFLQEVDRRYQPERVLLEQRHVAHPDPPGPEAAQKLGAVSGHRRHRRHHL